MFKMKREYKISLDENWVTPEETLLDSSSEHQDLEVPISNSMFRTFFFIIIILSVVILSLVFNLSIRRHSYFAGIAFQNKSTNFSIPPPRGIIFDRLGRPLVINEPVFDLLVVSREAKEITENINNVADILVRDRNEFQSFISGAINKNSLFFVESGLDKDQVLKIKTLNSKGFYIVPNIKRKYVDGIQFSQVLGYVGKISKSELDSDEYYYPTDTAGRLGIEAQYEKHLRGEHGKIFFEYNDEGILKNPAIGKNIVLNVDYDIQKHLFNDLFRVLNNSTYSKATAVVQNPQTGEVLAMVSFPTYDNNLFVKGLSDVQYKSLLKSESRPLFNRAISGLYNPGSTIKPLMGLMILEENVLSRSDTIKDCIGLTIVNPYNPDDVYTFDNWRIEYGPFNLKRAIANSCNVYFFIAGGGYGDIKGLGAERIASYLKLSFADSKLSVDLPGEEAGFVPTPNWKLTARGDRWYQGDTYNISIGQGDLLVTPLWLNSYISAVANGGNIFKPLVAKQILDSNKNIIKNFESEILGRLNFRKEVIAEVKNAMLETTISGTAKILGTLPIKSGAKTGTAEVIKGRSINSIMTAFAPFDNPEVSITVLIEGSATNQGLAVKVTYEFLKWYFEEYTGSN